MSKRHNRKRTRSRPRHRDGGKAHSNHTRTLSMDTNSSSYSTATSSLPSLHFPSALALAPTESWHPMYLWQNQLYYQHEREKARLDAAQRLRFFGLPSEDEEVSFISEHAMLKVVTDLFDGNIDYEDP